MGIKETLVCIALVMMMAMVTGVTFGKFGPGEDEEELDQVKIEILGAGRPRCEKFIESVQQIKELLLKENS